MRIHITLLFLTLASVLLDAQAYRQWIRSETREHDKLALIIGNADYLGQSNDLPGARADAKLMANTFARQGYDVILGTDLDKNSMNTTIRDFAQRISTYKSYIVYYAGHMLMANGVSYLLPVNINGTEEDVISSCISVDDDILSQIIDADKPKLVILDACRTAFRNFTRDELEQVRRRVNTRIIYATVSNTRVSDDNPFAEELTKNINLGGCIEPIERRVRISIYENHPEQLISSEGYLLDDVCFINLPVPENFVFVEGGTFQMDNQFSEGQFIEKPVHTVDVSSFYINKYEVTFAEYDVFCDATGREKPDDKDWGRVNRPVINVTWCDAVEYCNWLSKEHGLDPVYTYTYTNGYNGRVCRRPVLANWGANGYRLPTEAEWEYAARERGSQVRLGNGKDIADPTEINFYSHSGYKASYSILGIPRMATIPVGSLNSPNALGLHDMSGNVSEWCWDKYHYRYYYNSPRHNPKGPDHESYSYNLSQTIRGGSWQSPPYEIRSTSRNSLSCLKATSQVGFRLARTKY